jgi:LL-diaminopimelate aminotransferase
MRTTRRFDSLPVYLLATIPQKKRDLIARGVDVIDLGAGDADLPAPPAAVEALAQAAHDPSLRSRNGWRPASVMRSIPSRRSSR